MNTVAYPISFIGAAHIYIHVVWLLPVYTVQYSVTGDSYQTCILKLDVLYLSALLLNEVYAKYLYYIY